VPTNPKVSKRISEMNVEITKKGKGKGVTVSSYDVQVYATTGGFVALSMSGDGTPYDGLADLVSHVANLAACAEQEVGRLRQKQAAG
jgi:hypothetical protein